MPYMHGYPYGQTYDPSHPGYRGMPSVMMQNYPGGFGLCSSITVYPPEHHLEFSIYFTTVFARYFSFLGKLVSRMTKSFLRWFTCGLIAVFKLFFSEELTVSVEQLNGCSPTKRTM